MRITSIYVDGFGIFHDCGWEFPYPDLVLFTGPNEAGKTTLMQLIRFLLFGPEGKRAANQYPPLHGGRLGGYMTLVDSQGREYRLERYQGRTGGRQRSSLGPDSSLSPVPQALSSISRHFYQNVFAFGLEELQRLETIQDEEVSSRIYSVGLGLGSASLPEVMGELEAQIEELYKPWGRKPRLNATLTAIEASWRRIAGLKHRTGAYEQVLVSIEAVNRRMVQCEEEIRALNQRLVWLEKLSQALPLYQAREVAKRELERVPYVEAFPEAGIERLEALQLDLNQLEASIAAKEQQKAGLEEQASRLGLNAEILARAEDISALGSAIAVAEKALAELPECQSEVSAAQRAWELELRNLGPGWGAEQVQSLDTSVAVTETIRQFRVDMDAARDQERQAGQQVQLAQWNEEKVRSRLEEKRKQLEAARPMPRPATKPAIAILGLFGALAVVFLARGQTGAGLTLVALGVALSLAAWRWMGQLAQESQAERRQGLEADLTQLSRELELAQCDGGRAQASLAEAEAQVRQLQEQWKDWLGQRGLSADLSPEGAERLIAAVERARTALSSWEAARQRLDLRVREVEQLAHRVNQLLAELGRPAVSEPADFRVVQAARKLMDEFEREKERANSLRQVEQKLEDINQDLEGLRSQQAQLRKRREELLAQGGASDEDDFRRRAQDYQRRRKLEENMAKLEDQLEVLAAGKAASLYADLAAKTKEEIEAELEQGKAEKQRLEEEARALQKRWGELDNERQHYEHDHELGEELLTLEAHKEALREAFHRWAVLVICRRLLMQTRERYERERSPEIIRHASRALACMTEGRYPRILVPVGEKRLQIEDRRGRRLDTDQLSRGTAEQLYLAMRCGLIREYCSRAEPLPVVLDDILVNFDPGRAEAAVKTLVELCRLTQILVFTCHPEIASLFRQYGPSPITEIQLQP